MIARIWHGRVPADKADRYLELMRSVALPDYTATPGNEGAFALRQRRGAETHFLMLTFWTDETAIAAFAGDDIATAKYYDFDREFLLEFEPHATHYELYDS